MQLFAIFFGAQKLAHLFECMFFLLHYFTPLKKATKPASAFLYTHTHIVLCTFCGIMMSITTLNYIWHRTTLKCAYDFDNISFRTRFFLV